MRRWLRILAPALLGATLVLMLHGNQVAALVLAVAFFVAYVAADPRRPSRPRSPRAGAEEEAR